MEAAENNHLDAVKYLIKAGALVDPKVRASQGLASVPGDPAAVGRQPPPRLRALVGEGPVSRGRS